MRISSRSLIPESSRIPVCWVEQRLIYLGSGHCLQFRLAVRCGSTSACRVAWKRSSVGANARWGNCPNLRNLAVATRRSRTQLTCGVNGREPRSTRPRLMRPREQVDVHALLSKQILDELTAHLSMRQVASRLFPRARSSACESGQREPLRPRQTQVAFLSHEYESALRITNS
jgi:hypothetical protein